MLCVNKRTPLTLFQSRLLTLADPDFLLIIDPRLDEFRWAPELARAQWQPFWYGRVRERAERDEFRSLFHERVTLPTGDDDPPKVFDADRPGLTWRTAAILGLPFSNAAVTRVAQMDEGVVSPYRRSLQYLAQVAGLQRWVVFGDANDFSLAAEFWSLRALGGRPAWRPLDELESEALPKPIERFSQGIVLHAPGAEEAAAEAAARWSQAGRTVEAAPADPSQRLPNDTEPSWVRQTVPVPVHRDRLRLSTPGPRQLREPIPPRFPGVASFRIRSPEPGDPDGILLTRNERSRELVAEGPSGARRVTRHGVAEFLNVASPQLVQLPLVSYRDAVAAPFEAAGLPVSSSDKGDYQQLALERAGGLLYLSWLLRQPQSERLLDLFFETPGGQPASFRRAVTFAELTQRIHQTITPPSGRLRSEKRGAADAWLRTWTQKLLDRELMIGGYLLDCPHCRARGWYPASAVAQRHQCERCGAHNVVPASNSRTFRLNEAFFMMRQQGGQVVTLTLAALRKQAEESFLYLAETVVRDGATSREVDIAALVDGELVLVEAKSNNSLSANEVAKYRHLARRCGAKRVIFATTARPDVVCGGRSCDGCVAAFGEHHADRAWAVGAQALIQQARTALASDEIAVDTWCFYHLVGQHPTLPLEEFIRRPSEQKPTLPK